MNPSVRLAALVLMLLAAAAAAFWPESAPDIPPGELRRPAPVAARPLAMAWLDGETRHEPAALPSETASGEVETAPAIVAQAAPTVDWPYQVLGALRDAQGWRVFLALDDQALTVRPGDHLPEWRVLRIDAQGLWVQPRTGKAAQRWIKLPESHS